MATGPEAPATSCHAVAGFSFRPPPAVRGFGTLPNRLLLELCATRANPIPPCGPYKKQCAKAVCGLTVPKVPINDPKHWRDRAEEARTVADELTDPDSKRRMLRIAENYEELARCRTAAESCRQNFKLRYYPNSSASAEAYAQPVPCLRSGFEDGSAP